MSEPSSVPPADSALPLASPPPASPCAVAPLALPSGDSFATPSFDLGFARRNGAEGAETGFGPEGAAAAEGARASLGFARPDGPSPSFRRRSPCWISDVRPRPVTAPAAPLLAPLPPRRVESKVRIRFTRRGRKKLPSYRLVAVDARRARDAKPLEQLGWYDPLTKRHAVDLPAVRRWMDRGAQPSDTVRGLLVRLGALEKREYVPPPASPPQRWSRANPYPGSKRWKELQETAQETTDAA